jgi:EmrB/QacA subfamily drug resistance transporter
MPPASHSFPRPSDSRWLALIVLCAGMLMIVLDATIVNVALPSIQRDLGFSQATLAWVINAYLIAFGGILLLAGRLGDLIGRKRMFLAGLTAFTAASLLCGLAWSPELLVGARFLQGLGGAMTSAVILGVIVTTFREPREQARALGIYSFVASAGASIGLLLGGVLTQLLNWHWIFLVNLPIGIATWLLATRLLEDDRGIGLGEGADVPGAVLITAALMLGVYAIIRTEDMGWASAHTLTVGLAAMAALAGFVVREARARNPLLPLGVFRSRTMTGANVVLALMVAALFGTFFLGSLFLQRVLGYEALQIGLAWLPVSLGIGLMSLGLAEPLITRFGPRTVLLPGLALIGTGLVLFARAPLAASYLTDLLPAMLAIGLGAGIGFPSLMSLAMSSATQETSGLASGLVNTTQQVGGALGLSVLAAVATSQTDGLLAAGIVAAPALSGGYQLAFAIGAGLMVAAATVAATVLRPVAAPYEARHQTAPPAPETARSESI